MLYLFSCSLHRKKCHSIILLNQSNKCTLGNETSTKTQRSLSISCENFKSTVLFTQRLNTQILIYYNASLFLFLMQILMHQACLSYDIFWNTCCFCFRSLCLHRVVLSTWTNLLPTGVAMADAVLFRELQHLGAVCVIFDWADVRERMQ